MLQKIAKNCTKVLTTFRRYNNVPCGGPKDDRREARKFFERAPDEMPYACHWGSRTATNNKEERTRLRLFWCLFFPCCGPVTAPVIRLFFFKKCRFYGLFRPSSDQIFCSLQGRGEKRFEMQTAVALSQIWRVEKGHRPAPVRRQNEPEDSSVMAVVKRQSRNRNRRFAKTKRTDDPLVITISYPRFVVARPPLPPPPQIVWCRRAKDSVTERIPSDPDKAMEGRASRPHKSRAHSFVQNEPELAHAELSWARAAPVRTQCSQ
jgi:hypothetical protein